MGRSNRSKRSCNTSKGKATPRQIARLVDRYLFENRFTETQKSPNGMIPLEKLLNEYLLLKENKVEVEHERIRLYKEKITVDNLLHGMQNVMNTYNASYFAPRYLPIAPYPSGYSKYPLPIGMPVSLVDNRRVDSEDVLTHLNNQFISGKRKGPEFSVGAAPVAIRPRIAITQEKPTANEMNKITQACHATNNVSSHAPSGTLTLANNSAPNGLMMTGQGSGPVKCLFNKADSLLPTSSQFFGIPRKQAWSVNSNRLEKEVTPNNCTIGIEERFTISPLKEMTSYTAESSHLVSDSRLVRSDDLEMPNEKDNVNGMLNTDDKNTEMWLDVPASGDLLDAIDFSGLELMDENELFREVDLGFDLNLDYEGPAPEPLNRNLDLNQAMSEYASTVTDVNEEKDKNSTQGDAYES